MTRKLTRTERKKEFNYLSLLQAGKELFAEKGVKNTTIKDITERCDVGYGTFYLYFSNKEALLEATADEFAQNLIEYKTVRKLKDLTIRERMYYGTRDMLEFVLDNRLFLKAIGELSSNDTKYSHLVEEVWDKIFERMLSDHCYFAGKGYSNRDISIGSPSWMIYTWSLKGIIEGIVSSDIDSEEIDKLSKIYADMNYLTFINEDVQKQNK